jgi:hypothetical protein
MVGAWEIWFFIIQLLFQVAATSRWGVCSATSRSSLKALPHVFFSIFWGFVMTPYYTSLEASRKHASQGSALLRGSCVRQLGNQVPATPLDREQNLSNYLLEVKVGGWRVKKQGPLRIQSEDEKNLLPGERNKASVTGPSLDISGWCILPIYGPTNFFARARTFEDSTSTYIRKMGVHVLDSVIRDWWVLWNVRSHQQTMPKFWAKINLIGALLQKKMKLCKLLQIEGSVLIDIVPLLGSPI